MSSARAALQALAATDLLNTPDRAVFNEAALRLVPTQPGWFAVLLVHPSGRGHCGHCAGCNDAPSFTTAEWVERVVTTKRPAVSGLFQDATAGGYFFVVAVPVVRSGEVRSVLAAQIRSTSLSEILRRQSVPPNGVITLLDAAPVVMARTRGEGLFVGKVPGNGFSRRSLPGCARQLALDDARRHAGLCVDEPFAAHRPGQWRSVCRLTRWTTPSATQCSRWCSLARSSSGSEWSARWC